MVGRREAIARLDDGHGDAESGIHLGELTARRAAAEHEEAPRQLAGQGRLAVRPVGDRVESRHRRHLRSGADGDHDVSTVDHVDGVVVAHLDVAALGDSCLAAIRDGTDVLERLLVRGVIRLLGVDGAVHHEVTALRGLLPGPRGRVPLVARR